MRLVVAEKPSVARDLARVLGVPARGRTAFEGERCVITWCIGHLVELVEPAAYDPRWKPWRMESLPMIPSRFALQPQKATAAQFRAVQSLLRERRFAEVVNACDAGREGELIFRYVYELAGSRLPVMRLFISSLTDDAIREGFARLRPSRDFDALADAARCRSEADWLVGMNATRAVTLARRRGGDDTLYSIGRVQTPTLSLLVRREQEIRAFVPRDYFEVRGTFTAERRAPFAATWFSGKATRLSVEPEARRIVERDRAHAGRADPAGPVVERLRKKSVLEPPPLLFDLTALQRTANRRFGLSAARTLEIAQALYETHKVLTYPRTDSRHLTSDLEKPLPALFRALGNLPDYAAFTGRLLAGPAPTARALPRVFDDGKVRDHHAIIPTGARVDPSRLSLDERRLFDLVARRFLGAFFPAAEFAQTEVWVRVLDGAVASGEPRPDARAAPAVTAAQTATTATKGESDTEATLDAAPPPPDRYFARGRVRVHAGWQEVAGFGDEAAAQRSARRGRRASGAVSEGGTDDEEATREGTQPLPELPRLVEGERLDGAFEVQAKRTRPPSRHTEATLLAAMESAGRTIEDEALRQAMKDAGLGTPATRAQTIETLVKRGFVAREKKSLAPTATGERLIAALPIASLGSAELTGEWEARLARIARGGESRAAFMAGIERYVREIVDALRGATSTAASSTSTAGEHDLLAANRRVFDAEPVPAHVRSVLDEAAPHSGTAERTEGRESPKRRDRGRRTPAATGVAKARANRREEASAVVVDVLVCPRCRLGRLVTGHRGWGCSRWREGCGFVVWFETAGRRLTSVQLRDLVLRGKTRKATWAPNGVSREGRLVLDAQAEGGARFVPA